MSAFQRVYPFTTECINGYFRELDLKNKSILTVGSSLDQAFNALVLGASDIIVYDINRYTEEFYNIKRDIILNSSLDDVYRNVLNDDRISYSCDVFGPKALSKMNNYMESNDNYKLLQERLESPNISFITGSIYDMDIDKKFDRIILSNALQYLDSCCGTENPYDFLKKNFTNFKDHLNDGGVLQLLYLYGFSLCDIHYNKNSNSMMNVGKIVETLEPDILNVNMFEADDSRGDAIVTYTKKR